MPTSHSVTSNDHFILGFSHIQRAPQLTCQVTDYSTFLENVKFVDSSLIIIHVATYP